jgi:ElaB/YqjD/DUF883 family membrane-anchored ribosome-binding protein
MKTTTRKGRKAPPAPTEFEELVSASEAVLLSLRDQGGAAIADVKERLTQSIAAAKERIGEAAETIGDWSDEAQDFVEERPWVSLGIGTAVGFGLGILMASTWGRDR